MEKFIQEIKAVYLGENARKNHLVLFGIVMLYIIIGILLYKHDLSHIADIIYGIFMMGLSAVFINKMLHENKIELPSVKEFKLDIAVKSFGLMLVWVLYILFIMLIFAVILYTLTVLFSTIKPILATAGFLVFVIAAIASSFINMIFMGYADTYNLKGLFNPSLIFKIKEAFVPYIITTLKYMAFNIAAAIILTIGLIIAGGILSLLGTAGRISASILALAAILPFTYAVIILWRFSFFQALVPLYTAKVKPVITQIQQPQEY